MFTSRIEYTRPNTSVAFYKESSVKAAAFLEKLDLALTGAPGFVNKVEDLSADRLTLVTVYVWDTKEANDAFLVANKVLLENVKMHRDSYCKAKKITRKVI